MARRCNAKKAASCLAHKRWQGHVKRVKAPKRYSNRIEAMALRSRMRMFPGHRRGHRGRY